MSEEIYRLAVDMVKWYDLYDHFGLWDAYDSMDEAIDTIYRQLISSGSTKLKNEMIEYMEILADEEQDEFTIHLINTGNDIISRLERLERTSKSKRRFSRR